MLNIKGDDTLIKKLPMLFLCLLVILISIPAYATPIKVNFISIENYKSSAENTTLLDVRSSKSRINSNQIVSGAIWIDPNSGQALQDFIATSDKAKSYTIFCSCVDDNYSIRAAQLLTKNRFQNVKVLKGGWDSIKNSGMKLVPLDSEGK